MRYNPLMSSIYLSMDANPLLISYLTGLGHRVIDVFKSPFLTEGISSHPDLFLCKLGCLPCAPLLIGDPTLPKDPYPYDVPYNAVCTGKYFIHKLSATAPELLKAAKSMDLQFIDVHQGYTKCNVVVLDETGMITSDEGIHHAVTKMNQVQCLLVEPGHVLLDGFATGFIGGASGRIGDRIIFHGDLSKHPDFSSILDFISSRGLLCNWFEAFPLTDIGSIIECEV